MVIKPLTSPITKFHIQINLNYNSSYRYSTDEDFKCIEIKRNVLNDRVMDLRKTMWEKWSETVDEQIERGLGSKIFIFNRNSALLDDYLSSDTPLIINFSHEIESILKECKYLQVLNIENIPQSILRLYELRDEFWERKMKLLKIEESYNTIKINARDCELELIRNEVVELDTELDRAAHSMTWREYGMHQFN